MSSATATEETGLQLDELTAEWMRNLRSQLGRKRKRMSVKSVKLGLSRDEKSKTVDNFSSHYREARQRLENIAIQGVDVATQEKTFNELVGKAKEVSAAKVDKSGSEETRKKKIREVDEQFVTLIGQLKTIEKDLAKQAKDIPWSKNEAICRNKLQVFVNVWATDDAAKSNRTLFDTIVKDARDISKSDRKKKTKEVQKEFDDLLKSLNEKIDAAQKSKKDHETQIDQVEKALEQLASYWPQSKIDMEAQTLKTDLAQVPRRDWLEAKSKAEAAAKRAVKLLSDGRGHKHNYGLHLQTAQKQLQTYVEAGVPRNRQLDAAEELNRAKRLADDHDYAGAFDELNEFIRNNQAELQALTKAKEKWNSDWKSELALEINKVQSRLPEVLVSPILEELNRRVERMEYVFGQTGDLQIATRNLSELMTWFHGQVEALEISEDDTSPAGAAQKDFQDHYRDAKKAIEEVEAKIGMPAELLRARLEATPVQDYSRITKESDLVLAFEQGTRLLQGVISEAKKMLSSSTELEDQKQKESEEAQRLKLVKAHKQKIGECRAQASRVKDYGGEIGDLEKRLKEQAGADVTSVAGVQESNRQLDALLKELGSMLNDVTKEDGLLAQARRTIKTTYEELTKAYDENHKRLRRGDLNKVYEGIKTEADGILGFVIKSGSVAALVEANEQLSGLLKRLTDLGRDGEDATKLQTLLDTFAKVEKDTKNHKDFKFFFPEEYQQLLDEFGEAKKVLLGSISAERGSRLVNVLASKSKVGFSDAEKTREAYDEMTKHVDEVKKTLDWVYNVSDAEIYDTSYRKRYDEIRKIYDKHNPHAIMNNLSKSKKLWQEIDTMWGPNGANAWGAVAKLREDMEQCEYEEYQEEMRNRRRFEEWEGQLNLLRNGDWAEAKKAVSEHPDGDSKAIQMIRKQIHDVEKQGLKFNFDAAYSHLEVIRAQCKKMIRSPEGGTTSGSLKKLKGKWGETVKSLEDAVAELQAAVEKVADPKGEWPQYKDLVTNQMPLPLENFPSNVFESCIATMCDSKSSSRARLRAREVGLAHVQDFHRRLLDPLLQALRKNQFTVDIPLGAVYRRLGDLEYQLKTSN